MKSVWVVKLPFEWKKHFDEIAKNEGYKDERGTAAREVRRVIRDFLFETGWLKE
jgi:hypothetical protein